MKSYLDIVDKYKKRLEGMDKDIKDILKQEEEEKEVKILFLKTSIIS